jgi:hypothetical protein
MAGLDSDISTIDMSPGATARVAPETPEAGQALLVPAPSVLDDLKQALSVSVQNPEITLRVPAREHIDLVFNPNIEYSLIRRFYKQAETKDGVNQLKMAYMIISWTNVGVRVRGVLADDPAGERMTVKNQEFWKLLQARDTQDCIYKLFGEKAGEGHLINVADRILEEAGYGDPRAIGLDPLDG